jgi:hypothetical protein
MRRKVGRLSPAELLAEIDHDLALRLVRGPEPVTARTSATHLG